jgi:cobalt-zinc-cadmium efflux system outer membrane protein
VTQPDLRAWPLVIVLSSLLLLFVPSPSAAEEPLTLSDALRIALSDNPLILAWDAKVKAGEGGVEAAKAFPNPAIGGAFGRIIRFNPGKNEGAVELSQPLEWPSKRKYRREAAEMDLKSLHYEWDASRLNLVYEVKSSFYDLLLAQKGLEVARDNERWSQTLLSSAKIRVDVGEAPEYERIKAQVEVARARNEVKKAETRVSLAKGALNTLMGRPASSRLEIAGDLESAPKKMELEALLQKALQEHPSIRQQDFLVQKQKRLLDLARSSRYPDVTVSGFYEREPDKEVAGAGLSVPLPIWYQQKGEIQTALAEKARAEAEFLSLQNDIRRSVTEAYQNYLISADLVGVFTQQLLKQAEESRRIAEISYREGASGILDLIEAQRTARQTFLDFQQALFDLKAAEAALERATGGWGT